MIFEVREGMGKVGGRKRLEKPFGQNLAEFSERGSVLSACLKSRGLQSTVSSASKEKLARVAASCRLERQPTMKARAMKAGKTHGVRTFFPRVDPSQKPKPRVRQRRAMTEV